MSPIEYCVHYLYIEYNVFFSLQHMVWHSKMNLGKASGIVFSWALLIYLSVPGFSFEDASCSNDRSERHTPYAIRQGAGLPKAPAPDATVAKLYGVCEYASPNKLATCFLGQPVSPESRACHNAPGAHASHLTARVAYIYLHPPLVHSALSKIFAYQKTQPSNAPRDSSISSSSLLLKVPGNMMEHAHVRDPIAT